jgi:dTDP-4-dehydrorhamnose reductase
VKRLLITGGSSYLGQHLIPKAVEKYEVLYSYYSQDSVQDSVQDSGHLSSGIFLDVRDGDAVQELVQSWQPDAIIHTAGSNRSPDMETVITRGAENVTKAASEVGARLIHISTDVVFDGTKAPYHETALPAPVHAYGKAKAAAENLVARISDHVIVRTSLIYGLEMMDLSTRWIAEALAAGQEVTLFTDQIRNPVWTTTLCGACLELVESEFTGILNVAGRQAMSREQFGLKLLDWWQIDNRKTLVSGLSDKKWPVDCRYDLTLAITLLKTPLLGVDEVLEANRAKMPEPPQTRQQGARQTRAGPF